MKVKEFIEILTKEYAPDDELYFTTGGKEAEHTFDHVLVRPKSDSCGESGKGSMGSWKWNDALTNPPTERDDYLCFVEYDYNGKHYRTRKVLLFSNGEWMGLGRATDVVTYWTKFLDDPYVERCPVCLWPVQECRCNRS